jgi:hypothetical protein
MLLDSRCISDWIVILDFVSKNLQLLAAGGLGMSLDLGDLRENKVPAVR